MRSLPVSILLAAIAAQAMLFTAPAIAKPGSEKSVPEFGPDDDEAAQADPADDVPEKPPVDAGSAPPTPVNAGAGPVAPHVDLQASAKGEPNAIGIAQPGNELADADATELHIRPFGYIRVIGGVTEDDPGVEFIGRSDGFRLQNARVGVVAAWKNVSVKLSAEGAVDDRDDLNDVDGTLRFVLNDAFADFEFHRAATVRVGRSVVLFDIERFTPPSQRNFIDRSIESRGVRATQGFETRGLGVSRNLGVALRAPQAVGNTDGMALGYELAAQNGNGESDATNDNDSLAYSLALLATYKDTMVVIASARINSRTEGDLPVLLSEDDISAAIATRIEVAPLHIAGQFMFRRTDFETTGQPHEQGWGGHIEALLDIPSLPGLSAGYRIGVLDPSDLIIANRVIEHTFGLNYAAADRIRLQLNVSLAQEEQGRELTNNRIEAMVEIRL